MNNRFKLALQVSFQHEYYGSDFGSYAQIGPSTETNQWLTQHRCRFRSTSNGFELYVPEGIDLTTTELDELTFTIQPINPDFFQITDLKLLHYEQTNVPSLKQADLTENEAFPISIKLALAVADLGPDSAVVVHFEVHKCIWQYFIISPTTSDYSHQLVGELASQFSPPEETIISNGQNAVLFSSYPNPIAIPKPGDSISLSLKCTSTDGQTFSVDLPTPGPQGIQANDSGELMASVYVYI
ncbi:MAG: hypothetical protein AAFY36_14390 [Bacteroidota bacterium]